VPGQVATLHWRVVDAASVILVAGGQRVPVGAEGTTTLAPPGNAEVRLEAANNSGTAAATVQLQVIQPQAAPGPVFTPTPLPVPTVASLAVPAAAMPAAAPPTTLPATAVPQAPPAPQLTVRLLLPLVLRDMAQAAAANSPSLAVNGGTYPPSTPALVATAIVLTPAATVGVATPTSIPAAVLPTAALGADTAAAAAASPSQTQNQDTNRLLWTALAALLVLPTGLGLLGYLAWRLARRG
jgi:hypothetical protein